MKWCSLAVLAGFAWLAAGAEGDSIAEAVAAELRKSFGLRVEAAAVQILAVERFAARGERDGEEIRLRPAALRFESRVESYVWSGQAVEPSKGGEQPLRIRFRLPKLAEEVVLLHDKGAGSVIRETDVERQEAYWKPQGASRRAAVWGEVLGKECRRSLRAGTKLAAQDLAWAPLIRRGEKVQVERRLGKATLRFAALALREGSLGDSILVREMGKHGHMRAEVRGPGQVEVIGQE